MSAGRRSHDQTCLFDPTTTDGRLTDGYRERRPPASAVGRRL